MTNFLSLDIDFFNLSNHKPLGQKPKIFESKAALLATLERITDLAKKTNIPLHAVTNHQQMLGAVNNSQAERLVNIDFHSDLCCVDSNLHEINCGTWINYITWRSEGKYLWIHSGTAEEGDCGGLYDTVAKFRDDSDVTPAQLTGWQDVQEIKSNYA